MWSGYVKAMVALAAGGLAVLAAFVWIVNPYGNLPPGPRGNIVITDMNQRFMYPQIVRSGRYDALIVGTSTVRLLPPARLSAALGMRFAALGMNSATAFEQYQVADLFLRETPNPKGVLVGIDVVWCDARADVEKFTPRPFPEWMYDDNPWNDLLYMLNGKTAEIAVRQAAFYTGLRKRFRFGDDGYGVFTPPEETYDLERARQYIWQGRDPAIAPVAPPYQASAEERAAWRFPALEWLEEILDRFPDEAVKMVAAMPVHVAAQPVPGSREAAREAECKRRIAEIGKRTGALVVDFRIASELTREDANYWDPLHYRLAVADRLADWIAAAARGEAVAGAPYRVRTPAWPKTGRI